MSATALTIYLDRIREAAAANRALAELLAAQDAGENDLLQQIKSDYENGSLDVMEMHRLYVEYREIVRSSYPASWTSAGLPHPNSLHAAARKA